MKKYLFIFSLLSTMVMAQETPILLFPDGAPGETTKLKQKLIMTCVASALLSLTACASLQNVDNKWCQTKQS